MEKQVFETSQFLVACGRFSANLGKASRFFVIISMGGWGPCFEFLDSKIGAEKTSKNNESDTQSDAKGRHLEPTGYPE